VVCKLYEEVSNSLNLLKNFGSARMTGTGACVFLEVKSENKANTVLAKLPADVQAFVAKGINQSPLQKALIS
jgi:4-diphosphocytidyl-2-C-methyl-D-erythritol kinase